MPSYPRCIKIHLSNCVHIDFHNFFLSVSIGVDDPWSGFFVEPLVNGQTVAWPLGSPFRVPTKKFPGATFAPLGTVLSRLGSCMPDRFDEDEVCSLPGKSTTETHGGTTVATESSEE